MRTFRKSIFLVSAFVLLSVEMKAQTDASGYPVVSKGSKAADISGIDFSGKNMNLYSLHSDFILLFFYEPGCHFCEMIFPELKEKYPDWKKKGCELFAVPFSGDSITWRTFVKENELPWINIFENNAGEGARINYKLTVSPTIYLLDREKKICSTRMMRPEEIELALEELLKKKQEHVH